MASARYWSPDPARLSTTRTVFRRSNLEIEDKENLKMCVQQFFLKLTLRTDACCFFKYETRCLHLTTDNVFCSRASHFLACRCIEGARTLRRWLARCGHPAGLADLSAERACKATPTSATFSKAPRRSAKPTWKSSAGVWMSRLSPRSPGTPPTLFFFQGLIPPPIPSFPSFPI